MQPRQFYRVALSQGPSECMSTDLRFNADPYHRPSTANSFRSPRPGNSSRNSTPSVSPLSNTFETRENPSAKHEIDAVLASNGVAAEHLPEELENGAPSPGGSETGVSSSLSEFDGSLDDNDKIAAEDTPAHAIEEENESEAETERLGRTPQKPWRTGETGRTPSKLSQQATYDDEASDGELTPTARRRTSVSPSTARGTTGESFAVRVAAKD